jgi:hypothetical protein
MGSVSECERVFRMAALVGRVAHLHSRDLRFLILVALTLVVIGLHLGSSLRLAGKEGSGWRALDLEALQRRIETGELRNREAEWYHPATPEETAGGGL